MRETSLLHALLIISLSLSTCAVVFGQDTSYQSAYELGDPLCPCVMNASRVPPVDARDYQSGTLDTTVGIALVNSSTYGIGCRPHDSKTPQCTNDTINNCARRKKLIPAPLDCDTSWCERNWCFVDPTNCTLAQRRHLSFASSDRYYSYATCGDMDAFTNNRRFASLEDQVFKIGLNSNSGGWLGSYHATGQHFQGPMEKWSGMAVDFVVNAAVRGKFLLELAEPPKYLTNRSQDYFDSDSKFDLCVYATSLGYLDMCVAQYTITDRRASSTDWLLLGSQSIYLVVDTDDSRIGSFEFFVKSISTIFQPFTGETWAFIVLFVIPVLGALMIVHERGKGGSTYPTEEAVVVTDETTGESVLKKVPIPIYRSMIKSIYIAFLAVLQQSYEQSVLTLGAMLNLLGISFFILTIIAVYTANLAAILTQNTHQTSINSLEDAVRAGYRLCSERKNMETIMNLYPNLDPSTFAVDPRELGGDGLPGFNCAQCESRTRVFDFMDPILADSDRRYCHAAIAPSEDLDVLHAASTHCNKSSVGKAVQMIQTGMPIFENVSPQLISFFLKLKNDGHYDAALASNKPTSQCPATQGGEGSALTLAQLSGIWVVSFGFAAAGLLAKFIQGWYKNRQQSKSSFSIRRVHKRDQRGGRVDALGIQDSWMTRDSERSGVVRPPLLHEGSAAGSIRLMSPERGSFKAGSREKVEKELSWIRNRTDSKLDQGLFRRRRQAPSRSHSDCSDSFGMRGEVLHTESYSETGTVTENESTRERREKLMTLIDETAREAEETRQRDGGGSVELMRALDELAFVPSFSKDDSHV